MGRNFFLFFFRCGNVCTYVVRAYDKVELEKEKIALLPALKKGAFITFTKIRMKGMFTMR